MSATGVNVDKSIRGREQLTEYGDLYTTNGAGAGKGIDLKPKIKFKLNFEATINYTRTKVFGQD